MGNLNQPVSFAILNPSKYKPVKRYVDASYTGKKGDAVSLDSSGFATDTLSQIMCGIQVSGIIDGVTGEVNSTGSSTAGEDYILVVDDPNVEFVGQMTTGALTDPYTTRSSAAAFDIAGSAGVQYVDAGASTNDQVKVVKNFIEPDTGADSAVGAYQKKVFMFNPLKHFRGCIA